jgi:hypothetical protein
MISPGNSRSFSRILSLFQLLLGFCSLQTFRDFFLCHGLGKVYQMLTQHQARDLLFIIRWRALRVLLSVSIPLFPCLYFLYIFSQDGSRPILFLLSEGNSGQLGLPYPVVLRADILQLDHASIHGSG